jgi:hypothetical protein
MGTFRGGVRSQQYSARSRKSKSIVELGLARGRLQGVVGHCCRTAEKMIFLES